MPEYLAPGVFVEEVSFRAKSIEGVPTSTTGFAGMTRWGPVAWIGGPTTTEPRLITSFTEFERVYGGLESLNIAGDERVNYMAHAARAYFLNGGKRLYVSRVFVAPAGTTGAAVSTFDVNGTQAAWSARWPGLAGEVVVTTRVTRGKDVTYTHPTFGRQARGARHGSLVEVDPPPPPVGGFTPPPLPQPQDPLLDAAHLAVVTVDADGRQT